MNKILPTLDDTIPPYDVMARCLVLQQKADQKRNFRSSNFKPGGTISVDEEVSIIHFKDPGPRELMTREQFNNSEVAPPVVPKPAQIAAAHKRIYGE